MLRKFQAERLETMKTDLGEYGEAWSRKLYLDENIFYEGGAPHRFWLHVDSKVVWELNMFIKASSPHGLSDQEFSQLKEGSLVLARYSDDNEIYRAQVEKVLIKEAGQKTVCVRFFDYGNSDQLGVENLFQWEERYDQIKPQAVACRLASFTTHQLSHRQREEFNLTMRSFGKMRLRVLEVLQSGDSVSTCLGGRKSGPDLVVQLFKDDLCVETRLKHSPILKEVFTEKVKAVNTRELGMSFMEKVELYLGYEGEKETPPPPQVIQKQNKRKKEGKARVNAGAGGLETKRKIERKEVEHVEPGNFIFPAEDKRFKIKDADRALKAVKSPGLKIQLQELFNFRMAFIKSTEEFYIFPGQNYSQRLKVQLYPTEKMIPAVFEEVKINTVWMVKFEDLYERVQVIQVDGEARTVELLWIDSGLQQCGVPLSNLFKVPDGPARDLPGLVVRCHLAGIFSTSSEATETMKELFPFSQEVHARLTDLFNGESFGLDVICPNQDIFNDVLINHNLAEISFQEGFDSSDVIIGTDNGAGDDNWDPMAEDYMDFSNNYKTTDQDIDFATDGYKSKQMVCPLFMKNGRCYKGELCEDRHVQLRPAAVTADQEEVIIKTLDQSDIPSRDTPVLLKISHISSPSSFFCTFPHGGRNIFTLSKEAKKAAFSREFLDLFADMQESYQGKFRVHAMESLPTPGTLLAVRLGKNIWHRAKLAEEEDEQGILQVFLVDIGRVETVTRRDIWKLQDCFTIFPFQAHEVELNMLEPQVGVWKPETKSAMKNLVEGCDHLSGKVVKVLPNEKLVMEVSTVCGEEEVDIGKKLCDFRLARRVAEIEKSKRSGQCSYFPG